MDSLSNQRRLAYGNYVDTSKPLRRKLKQLGAGSVEAGLRVVRTNEPALTEICSLIDVSPQEVLKELENVTSELDDLATIYTKTVEGNAVEEQLYIRECEDIFDQVCRCMGPHRRRRVLICAMRRRILVVLNTRRMLKHCPAHPFKTLH